MHELAQGPNAWAEQSKKNDGHYHVLIIHDVSGHSRPIHPYGDPVRLSFIITARVQYRLPPSIVWRLIIRA